MKLNRIAAPALAAAALLLLAGCQKPRLTPVQTITATGPSVAAAQSSAAYDTSASLSPSYVNAPAASTTDGDLIPVRDAAETAETAVPADGRGVLEPVFFDLNQYGLKAAERAKAGAAKTYLDQNPSAKLLLEGHCDWRGTAEYNLGLGDRRATAVKNYLQDLGVSPARLDTLTRGDLDAVEKADEAVMARDRRVEFIIKK